MTRSIGSIGSKGRKYIILISTGVDTFSKLNLDQILKKVKTTKNITIFSVSMGRALREYMESHGSGADGWVSRFSTWTTCKPTTS